MHRPSLDVRIGPPVVGELAQALACILAELPEAQRGEQIEQVLAESKRSPQGFQGMLVARAGGQVIGAAWARLQPGRTCLLLPPQMSRADEATALRLVERSLDFCRKHGVRLVQSLVMLDHGPAADCLRSGGVKYLADLIYLVSSRADFPETEPPGALTFDVCTPKREGELLEVLQRTYLDTQDCPELNGVRDIKDVVAGYRAVGTFDPALWRLARKNGKAVGCVLLARHRASALFELVYMGLVPDARGKGNATTIIRHAQWLAGSEGCEHLVLAVDARNARALRVYTAAGFVAWDRRSVFLKILSGAGK